MIIRIIFITACLVFSNFLYQAITKKNYRVAVERSWFQVTGIATVVFMIQNSIIW